jgi:tryptophan-rich hypothetical protein
LKNKIDPKKLLNSKWTDLAPTNKDKHFMVTRLETNKEGTVVSCSLEPVMSKLRKSIDWRDLQDEDRWAQGWK